MPSNLPANQFNYTDLRHRGTLQTNMPVTDDAGGQTDAYVDIVTTWVGIVKKTGRYTNADGRILFSKSFDLYCREQDAVVVNVDSRWTIGTDMYKIVDFELVDDSPSYFHFICTRENG